MGNINVFGATMEIVKKQTLSEILVSPVPVWMAVVIGVVIGWSWKSTASYVVLFVFSVVKKLCRFMWTLLPGLDARRVSLAFTAFSVLSLARQLWSWNGGRGEGESEGEGRMGDGEDLGVEGSVGDVNSRTPDISEAERVILKDGLVHFLELLDDKDGKTAWEPIMEHSIPNMSYQAWRHEAEFGSIVYRTRTVFEEATPEVVRDFFWDDGFRPKWDTMLAYVKILEECPNTGMMIMHWIKKFPFIWKDREYIIGRRIWEAGRTYYCITKGVPYPSVSRSENLFRVDRYFSSWVIRAVQSREGNGELSACEVMLIHYEDMGLPKDVTKFGVRHGMWGAVQKTHTGFRDYQTLRESGVLHSKYALMSSIMTSISADEEGTHKVESLISQEERGEQALINAQAHQGKCGLNWKWIVIGGTVGVMCGLHAGFIGKILLVGVRQRVARRRVNGGMTCPKGRK